MSGKEAAEVAAARGATPRQLVRQLRGDLDWIVARALDPVASRRYPTAAAMASDLDMVLAHQPVTAAPRRAAYRLHKAIHRHPVRTLSAGTLGALTWRWCRAPDGSFKVT